MFWRQSSSISSRWYPRVYRGAVVRWRRQGILLTHHVKVSTKTVVWDKQSASCGEHPRGGVSSCLWISKRPQAACSIRIKWSRIHGILRLRVFRVVLAKHEVWNFYVDGTLMWKILSFWKPQSGIVSAFFARGPLAMCILVSSIALAARMMRLLGTWGSLSKT